MLLGKRKGAHATKIERSARQARATQNRQNQQLPYIRNRLHPTERDRPPLHSQRIGPAAFASPTMTDCLMMHFVALKSVTVFVDTHLFCICTSLVQAPCHQASLVSCRSFSLESPDPRICPKITCIVACWSYTLHAGSSDPKA
jgi:hypothetical protein